MISEPSPPLLRLCRFIRYASAAFVVGVLFLYVATWLVPPQAHSAHTLAFAVHLAGLPVNAFAEMDMGARLLMCAISVPYLAALVWAFWRLNRMLVRFERGEFFDSVTVGHLRAFSGYLLLAKILSLAAMHLRVFVATRWFGVHGAGLVNLSSDDMAVLLMCALFFLIARAMEEARRLAEENKEFV